LAELLGLCNASVPEMMVKADSIAEHVISKYLAAKEKIKIFFQSVSSKNSLTCDLWTSPNRLAILCVTSHWTDKDLEVREIILDAVKTEGPHTGEYIASHILVVLKDFNLENKLFCITADNASNNKSMARALSIQVRQFNFGEHLLGCIGHIIHLAAKQGLKALGLCKPPTNVDASEESNNNDQSDVDEYAPDLDSLPSVPGTIMFRIHSIVIAVRSSPQRTAAFRDVAKIAYAEEKDVAKLMLIQDATTRWNSSYSMGERFLRLRKAVELFNASDKSFEQLKLVEEDWEDLTSILKILKPLEEATRYLSASKYPNIISSMRTYDGLMIQVRKAARTYKGIPVY
jgi:hypothetical protein